MNLKKIVQVSIIILVVIGISLGIYLFFNNPTTLDNVTTAIFGDDQPTNTAPVIQEINLVAENEIFDYWVSNNFIYYITKSGEIVRISNSSQDVLNSQTLNKLNKIEPSFDGSRIIAKFNYPNLPTFSTFSVSTGNWTPLPEGVIAATWSPNSNELVYLDESSLNIYNPSTQKTTKVLNMTQKEVDLDWVSSSEVFLSTLPSIDNNSSLWSINLNTDRLTKLINEEAGLMMNWSKTDELGLKLHNEKRTAFTSLVSMDGNTLATFSFVTMPSKCIFDSPRIYCAIPNDIPEGVALPDDYLKRATYFDDGLYLIDISADSATILSNPDDLLIDADHLELFGENLLFKNRIDDRLYSLSL
ncbi:hypothetical protein GW950_00385 [Candidatus Wolfebacteria bacterium]|nr:hypothetical protein [Candidatus Wolfebacteria bacterium]